MTYIILSISLATAILVSYITHYIFQSFKNNDKKVMQINLDDNWILPKENEKTKENVKYINKKKELINPIHNVFRDISGRFRSIKDLE